VSVPRAWCSESGKAWDSFTSYDQCPRCGRMVAKTPDGRVPSHIEADGEYHDEQAARVSSDSHSDAV